MNIIQTLREVGGYLDSRDVPWCVIGGLAVSARAAPRFTLDADLAVAVDSDESAETIVRDLIRAGFVVATTIEQETAHRFAGVQLVRPNTTGTFGIDLMFASSGIESEVARDASRIELVPGEVAPVAPMPHLIALKVLSRDERRPQDDVDLQSLLGAATSVDIARARELLELIASRGFARGKDLHTEFESVIERFGGQHS